MNQLFLNSAVAGVLITIAAYQLGIFLKRKLKWSLFNPVLIAAAVIIPALLLLDIDYGVYEEGAKYISYLLTPATICLAVPLYEQIEVLKKKRAGHPRRHLFRGFDQLALHFGIRSAFQIRSPALCYAAAKVHYHRHGDRRFPGAGRYCYHYRHDHYCYRDYRQYPGRCHF